MLGLVDLVPLFRWLFSTHFFGLTIKFGYSIPWALDLDSHSVKRPLVWLLGLRSRPVELKSLGLRIK